MPQARGPRPGGVRDPYRWFPADVYLLDTTTGERRVYESWQIEPDADGYGGCEFMFKEGNYSCDCNRELFFKRAGGEDPDVGSVECGERRYRVEKIVNVETKMVVYQEGGDGAAG